MSRIEEILRAAKEQKASDIHLCHDCPVMIRVDGDMIPLSEEKIMSEEIEQMTRSMLADDQMKELEEKGELDFAYSLEGFNRVRVNVFRQKGTYAMALRILAFEVPHPKDLGIPEAIVDLTKKKRGMVLVTGATGSGKSTTLASLIGVIARTYQKTIITLEDPIEYLHEHSKSMVLQREIGSDSQSYANAVKAALRQDPDVILVGEMRDYETISAAVTAAETGHLVMSTLHTTGAAQTLDRIIDSCPPHAQNQIRTQLSTILKGVITQALIPLAMGGGRVAATEILVGTDAVGSLIRDNKCFQLATVMQSSAALGMHTLNADLARLVRAGTIRRDDAIRVSNNKNEILDLLS